MTKTTANTQAVDRQIDRFVMCHCPWCDKNTLSMDKYRDGFFIVECSNCHFDDKDNKEVLTKRYVVSK